MTRRSEPLLLVRLQTGNGQQFEVVSDSVKSMTYVDEERRADKCTLMVDNYDLTNFDDPVWKKGGKLIVSWGYAGNMTIPRTCVIAKVTGFTTLTVEAHAESVLMNTKSKCRVFENQRRSDVVRFIAEENGYSGANAIIDETDEVFEVIAQHGITDAQFVNRLSRREGFEFYVDHQGFHWHARRLGARPVRRIQYFTGGKGDINGDITIDNDITKRPGRVRVRARNPMTGEDIEAVADDVEDGDRETLSETQEIINGEAYTTEAVEVNMAQEETISTSQSTPGAVRREAQARFRRAQQVAVKATIPIIGDPQIYAKTIIELAGVGKRLSQLYYLKTVTHKLDQGGYTTTLKAVSDGHGGHATTSPRARGLSAIQAGRTRRSGAGGAASRQEVLDSLRQLEEAARANGSEEAAILAIQARATFESRGFRSATDVRNAAVALARVGEQTGDSGLVRGATVAANALAQGRTGEAATGGRRNGQSAPNGTETGPEVLVPSEEIDGDGFGTRTSFHPARSSRPDSD